MAGNNQNNETNRKGKPPFLPSGRASKAVGDPKEKLMQSTRMEQRANMSNMPPSSRGTARIPAMTKATPTKRRGTRSTGTKSASNSSKTARAGGGTTKRAPTPQVNRPIPVVAPIPSLNPRDIRFMQWANNKWNTLEPHHQQRFFSVCLLILSLLLFGSLTVFQTAPILSGIRHFFLAFFGWSAYLLAVGLVIFALAHLLEGIQRKQFVRLSLVTGLVCIWLLLLIESALIVGPENVGVLGALLVLPLLGWSRGVDHVIVLGLLLIAIIMTFRLTFGHVLLVSHYLKRWFANSELATHKLGEKISRADRSDKNAPTQRLPSPFLGQRPQYSRYSAVGSRPDDDEADEEEFEAQATQVLSQNAQPAQRRMGGGPTLILEDDELDIEVELEDDDDPLNDINIHKQHVSAVPRGTRTARALDYQEHQQAIQGVQQQQLAFNQSQNAEAGIERMPSLPPGKMILKPPIEMEPLAPNPRLLAQNARPPRGSLEQSNSVAQVQATPEKKRASKKGTIAPVEPAIPEAVIPHQSLWKLPGTSLLNSPDTAKLQLYVDDTGELAKVIQNTLRSFRVDAEVRAEDISIGPTVIRFGIRPTGKPEMRKDDKTGKMEVVIDAANNIVYETRTRVSRIMALQNDLALVLEAKTIRMEAPVPGRPYVGVEIPNKNSRLVTLREVLESKEYQPAQAKSKLAIGLGKDVAGQVRVGDLAKMPHLLIAGATGAGKCLAYGEPIFLADGQVVKVQELVGQTVHVIGVTDIETMQQTPVPATFTENGVQETFEIELDNGIILRRTGEHPLWAAGLNENQHVGRQSDGKAARRTRAIDAGWVQAKDLRVCGNRPNFDGHVILCPLSLDQQARPLIDQKFADCPQGYEWRKIVDIRRSTSPTVTIEVHSENHAFVGYAVEHNSVCLNTIIASVLIQATPDDVRLLMVDPKMVELNMYNGIPHLLSPVVVEVDKVVSLLKNAIHEMERRYRLFSQLGVRNLDGYRKMRQEKMAKGDNSLGNLPAIVIIIDELADLMMAAAEEVEGMICRLAQLARATGIHLIVATQRPSVDVITGLIKANIPTRISFMVSSAVDSRTIIDMGGAERLLGRGDMLYLPADAGRPERIQGAFLSDDEAQALADYWRHQLSTFDSEPGEAGEEATEVETPRTVVEPGWELKEVPTDETELDDDLLDKAEEVVREYGRASISLLQRRLRVGYSRAARLIDLLEDRGIIGHSEAGGRAREVYDNGNAGGMGGEQENHGHAARGDGHSIAAEVADIVAEERARNDFLREQAARFQQQQQRAENDNNE